jgi:hypothetical protein
MTAGASGWHEPNIRVGIWQYDHLGALQRPQGCEIAMLIRAAFGANRVGDRCEKLFAAIVWD